MKVKTSELTGAALDWAARASLDRGMLFFFGILPNDGQPMGTFSPSTNWAQGGPIIERELIDLSWQYGGRPDWSAWRASDPCKCSEGSTPLIAATRCLVASRLGDEVDVPEELL